MSAISPEKLLSKNGMPRSLGLAVPIRLFHLAEEYGMKCSGEDLEIKYLRTCQMKAESEPYLSYINTSQDMGKSDASVNRILIVNERQKDAFPSGAALLITEEVPQLTFCKVLNDLIKKGRFEVLLSYTDAKATVAKSAIIHPNVYICKDAFVGEGAVLLPNTFVGDGVVVSENATIGSESIGLFSSLKERPRVSHAGGVWLSEGVEVGPVTCIDRGVSGEFTFIGVEAKVDNLIHIASGVSIGQHCALPGSSYVGNDTVIEEGAWIGPKTVIGARLHVGSSAYIGTGCLIATDQPSQALVYGVNSRAYGWACFCRNKLDFTDGSAVCSQCGKSFRLSQDKRSVSPTSN